MNYPVLGSIILDSSCSGIVKTTIPARTAVGTGLRAPISFRVHARLCILLHFPQPRRSYAHGYRTWEQGRREGVHAF